MRLFFDSQEHYNYLHECLATKPVRVMAASYGLYAGILPDGRDTTTWGARYQSPVRDFLNALEVVPTVQLLIGLYEFKSCQGNTHCYHCERRYVLDLCRLLNHAEKFPKFTWRVSPQSHIKAIIFEYEDSVIRGVTGGRNLTDSTWTDVTVELDKMSTLRLAEQTTTLWQQSLVFDGDCLTRLAKEQGITDATLDRLFKELE